MLWQKNSFPFSNPNAFVFSSRKPSARHKRSLIVISLFTTMNAFSFTPSSLLSKNDACLSNPFLSYQWWFYFCLFLLEQLTEPGGHCTDNTLCFYACHTAQIRISSRNSLVACCPQTGLLEILHHQLIPGIILVQLETNYTL